MYADELKRKREKIKALQELKKTRAEEQKLSSEKRSTKLSLKKSEKEFDLADYEKEFGLKKKETAEVGTNTEEVVPSCPKKEIVLSIIHHEVMEIKSEPPLAYSKETQTQSSSTTGGNMLSYNESSQDKDEEDFPLDLENSFNSKLPPGVLTHGLPNPEFVAPAQTEIELELKEEVEAKELSEEQKLHIILSEEFQKFMLRSSKLMERALTENTDIFTDYVRDSAGIALDKFSAGISENRIFYCNRWCKNRCVTSIDWSPHFPELMIVSYHKNEDNPRDPDGIVAVWNHKFKKETPEDVFQYSSPILTACFAKFNHNLLLGGTYSGQIVVWDNRLPKRTPIQKSPLSSVAHTHPIYSMTIIGTLHAHNVVSISSDGKLCIWTLENLAKPLDVIVLNDTLKEMKAISITCMEFLDEEVNNFVVGTESGSIYSACLRGKKTGITDKYGKHLGHITGISTHCSYDFRNFFLTSSVDWTIKLWRVGTATPIYSFEHNSDYVMDVAWSPINPALFATVDGSGKLDIWNLNQDIELPIITIPVADAPGLNRISWSPNGSQLTLGDEGGNAYVYDVADNIVQPRVDEWARFSTTIENIMAMEITTDLVDTLDTVVETPRTPPPSLLDINAFFRSITPTPPSIEVEEID